MKKLVLVLLLTGCAGTHSAGALPPSAASPTAPYTLDGTLKQVSFRSWFRNTNSITNPFDPAKKASVNLPLTIDGDYGTLIVTWIPAGSSLPIVGPIRSRYK